MPIDLGSMLSDAFQTGRLFYESTAQNEVNAPNGDYVRLSAHMKTAQCGGKSLGVMVGSLHRCTDPLIGACLNQAKLSYEGLKATLSFHQEFQGLLGQVGDEERSLPGLVAAFARALESPSEIQGSVACFRNVVQQASNVAGEFRRLSHVLCELRSKADRNIREGVDRINDLLKEYHNLNTGLVVDQSLEVQGFQLQDRKEAIVRELSGYMDVVQTPDRDMNGASPAHYLWGPDGVPLVMRSGPHHLTFQSSGTLTPGMSLEDGDLSGVFLQFDQLEKDLTGRFKTGGQLDAWLTLRDQTIPALQSSLDQAAFQFQKYVNHVHAQGTSFKAPTELRSAFSVDGALNWGATGGTLRVATVTRDRGAVVAFLDIDLATVSTVDELITEIETLTGVTMGQDAEGRLIVTVAQTPGQPGLGIAFRPLDENAATVGDMLGLNNLFVGSEGQRLEDPHTQAGAALHITVNPRIARDPAQIAHALLSDAPDLASGDTGLQVADWRNLADVYQEMGQAWEFKATQGLAEQRTTPFDYLRLFISHAAEEAFTAKGVLEVSRLTYTSWEKSLQEAQGVDMNMNNAQKMMWSEYMRNVMHLMGMTLRLNSELLQILRSL